MDTNDGKKDEKMEGRKESIDPSYEVIRRLNSTLTSKEAVVQVVAKQVHATGCLG